MKRAINIFLISIVALSFVGCGNKYEEKALEWLWANADVHFMNCPNDDNSIYYLDREAAKLCKVDLETKEKVVVEELPGEDATTIRFASISGFVLPADRGLGESTLFTLVTRLKDNNDKLVDDYMYTLLVDASTNTAKIVNKSFSTNVYGDLVFSDVKDAKYANQLKGVTTYDVNGNAVEPRVFKGTIAKQNVTAELWVSKNRIFGSYYYDKYGPENRIRLIGELTEDNHFDIVGSQDNYFYNFWGSLMSASHTEYWKGKLEEGRIEAGFHKYPTNPKLYDFTLTEVLPATEVVE